MKSCSATLSGITIMADALVFGSPKPNVEYKERRAAYVVIIVDDHVATVKFRRQHFLPGGGSLSDESPEETIVREVSEELARRVRLTRSIGEAIQYFYADADDQHYKMRAAFFAGEFASEPCDGTGEHELSWLPVTKVEQFCFHSCHAWAVQEALALDQRS